MGVKVEITNDQKKIKGTREIKMLIKEVVLAVLNSEGFKEDTSVSVRLVDNKEIRLLNSTFRNINRETDVLSFPAEEKGFLGDMAISLERAKKQSEEYNHSFRREVAFLTAHSILHLLGYDHMEKDEEREMFEKQEKVLEKLSLTRND